MRGGRGARAASVAVSVAVELLDDILYNTMNNDRPNCESWREKTIFIALGNSLLSSLDAVL